MVCLDLLDWTIELDECVYFPLIQLYIQTQFHVLVKPGTLAAVSKMDTEVIKVN